MGLTYFKRFDMEIELTPPLACPPLPAGYFWIPWSEAVLPAHADTKYRSFRCEIDANVFPCLGDADGCVRLMGDIVRKEGFLPPATWLIGWQPVSGHPVEYCGTIQGIRDLNGLGAVQNLGVVPEHRRKGLGRYLMLKALLGFAECGLQRAFLQVTARNIGAIQLYRDLGFRKSRTLYKVVDLAYA